MNAIKNFVKKELSGWNKIELLFIFIGIPLIAVLSIAMKDSIVATFSAIFGLLYTIIAGKGKISCYFFGIIATLCYSYLAYKNALYGNFALNFCYYLPMQILGIFLWKKHLNKQNNEIYKTFLNNKERLLLAIISVFLTIISSLILKNLDDKFPIIDSITTILSLAGMYLTVKRCIEQWLVWTIVNSLSVLMWVIVFIEGGKTFATVVMWSVYLILGIYFFKKWQKEITS